MSKYKVHDINVLSQNWLTSKAYCEASGWGLATIETDEELKFLESKFEMYVFWGCKFCLLFSIVRNIQEAS